MNYALKMASTFWCCLFPFFLLNAQGGDTTTTTLPQVTTPEIEPTLEVRRTGVSVAGNDAQLIFKTFDEKGDFTPFNGIYDVSDDYATQTVQFVNGTATTPLDATAKGNLILTTNAAGDHQLFHLSKLKDDSVRMREIPLWLSIIPPLLAIAFALFFREVVMSLFLGVWAGAFIAGGMRIESLYYFLVSLFEVVEKYVIRALADTGHLSVIIFSLLIGGMVAIISRNGGMAGVVNKLSKYAKDPVSAQFITWLLGVAIFFDDYANTLIVGNTMRSVTDKFKISREKLAYIVDSTAAPVAAVAFITTWIGAELGYIGDGISQIEGAISEMTPYAVFLASLKYSFYPILTLMFILLIVFSRRDYGPMLEAEKRARNTGEVKNSRVNSKDYEEDVEDLSPVKGAPLRWYNAVLPVLTVIFVTIFGLLDTGFNSVYSDLIESTTPPLSTAWSDVWTALAQSNPSAGLFMKLGVLIGSSDSYIALLWASLSGVLMAIIMTLSGKIMNISETMDTLATGFKTMLPALLILTFAWSLAITTEELHTATFLSSLLQDSISPYFMPPLVFVLAAVIAFSTGSSWSTMAILYPIAIPTTFAICAAQGMDSIIASEILLNVISVVLAASVLGDHCSPISDTTILSSLASDCNHIDHVKTQMPYALTVGTVSLIAGTVSTLLGGSWLISIILLVVSFATLWFIVRRFGKEVV